MFFANVAVLFAAAALCGLSAASPGVNATAPLPIGTHTTPVGELTLWGWGGGQPAARECGAPVVTCGGYGAPEEGSCALLIEAARAGGDFQLGPGAGGVCLVAPSGQCCVSWAHSGPGLVLAVLAPIANNIFAECVAEGAIEGGGRPGIAHNEQLRGVCTQVCLSSHPTGCGA